ncbi:hypothetical protein [Aureimonas mangrovi]|uniref:hypothetical protein n=1 Tax=Aureimonas mangrovi TaxID=2758041 RepID=UPI00163DD094|nr:hypothetical protein [Aureimonas mangrovi]
MSVQLQNLSMRELRDAREAMVTVADVLSGLLCQPRFIRDGLYNNAGEILDDLCNLVCNFAEQMEDEAASRSADLTPAEATTRAFLLMMAQAEREDADCRDLVALAEEAASDRRAA